jgi:hypothetical protein
MNRIEFDKRFHCDILSGKKTLTTRKISSDLKVGEVYEFFSGRLYITGAHLISIDFENKKVESLSPFFDDTFFFNQEGFETKDDFFKYLWEIGYKKSGKYITYSFQTIYTIIKEDQ